MVSHVDVFDQRDTEDSTPSGGPPVPWSGPGRLVRHRLSAAAADKAFALAKSCAAAYGSAHDEGFLADAPVLAHDLPSSVRRAANAARLDDRKHAFILSGNTIEPWLEPTPAFWHEADTEASGPYGFLLVLYAALLGDPIGWGTQQDGRVVTDVLPARGLEHSLVSASSERELGWHTEDAFSESRADHVGLFCLRDRGDIPTTLSCADPASLPRDIVRVLAQKRFVIHPDPSHSAAVGTGPDRERVALLSGPGEAPVLRIDRDFTVADEDDPEAVRAMEALIAQLDANMYEVVLGAGDVCFIDNRNVVHGRRPFRAGFDGKDRWLKRVNVVTDLRRTRDGRPSSSSRVVG
ncbi:TauD/TfdA family dioxygenase [Streptomyces castrisilvae]|uniref:TauD/TfdA family dioxygenase n=1 Tax=Streptomyces castrisilvae TaxID=3033811 RepID=A0ABY9HDH3_9ACTN|nr:TauD/TfdA family dioxygenase [Streptomyces sp. Mut1]WLQ32264.1 TauD/TfdA family dioxygenase [Streptomyces sp. Mut1]